VKINGDNEVAAPAGATPGRAGRGPAKARQDSRQGDALEISGETGGAARTLVDKPGIRGAGSEIGATLKRVRVELNQRIRSGFYDSDEVLASIAESMLDLFGL